MPSDAETIVSKRLIISGLTPAIDAHTLTQRLSSFGNVHSLVGVGMLDANGSPRKFAHLTMETTKAKLSRCMQAFSGSTWKGARLRLGEAKPTFSERKRALEDVASDVPPTKHAKTAKEERLERKLKLRLKRSIKAKHAQDMSLVTLKNVDRRKFWKSTSDGHIIRPIRMRPLRPLPSILIPKAAKHPAVKSNPFRPSKMPVKITAPSQMKKRLVLSRARHTIIDPVRYGSRHMFFPHGTDGMPRRRESDSRWEFDDEQQQWVELGGAGDVLTIEATRKATIELPRLESTASAPILPVPRTPFESSIEPLSTTGPIVDPSANGTVRLSQPPAPSQPGPRDEISEQLADEKAKGLAIMQNLLANGWALDLDELETKDDSKTHANIVLRRPSISGSVISGAREDGNEGDELAEDTSHPGIGHTQFDGDTCDSESGEYDDDIQDIQMQPAKATSPAKSTTVAESSASPNAVKEFRILSPSLQLVPAPATQTQSKSLKEMFAPREDEGGFSLFGNLAASGVDLDDFELESDQEQSYHAEATPRAISHSVILEEVPAPVPVMRAQLTRDEVISFDPSIPLLFPVPPRLRSSKKGARPKDIFDIAKDKGWTGGFYKTATDDEIKQLWESVRGDLTRQYKKRHREAMKKRKRGHGITMADREAE